MKHIALTDSETTSVLLALYSYLRMRERGDLFIADSTLSDLHRAIAELERKEII